MQCYGHIAARRLTEPELWTEREAQLLRLGDSDVKLYYRFSFVWTDTRILYALGHEDINVVGFAQVYHICTLLETTKYISMDS